MSSDVEDTYNMISVDGDTSTNDTALLLANGMVPEMRRSKKAHRNLMHSKRLFIM